MSAATIALAPAMADADAHQRRPDVERVAEPPVGPGAGDLAALLEVPGGPDAERSRPRRATTVPAASARQVGLASQRTSDARHETRGARAARARRRQTFSHACLHRPAGGRRRRPPRSTRDRVDARRRAPAPPLVMALAVVEPRHPHVRGAPRPVPQRVRRPEHADDRRADGGRQLQRPGVAGDEHGRGPGDRHEIGDRSSRARPARRRPTRPRPAPRAPALAGPHVTIDGSPWRARRCAAMAPKRSAGPLLVRPAGAGVDHRERPPASMLQSSRTSPRHAERPARQRERRSRRARAERLDERQVLADDVAAVVRRERASCRTAPARGSRSCAGDETRRLARAREPGEIGGLQQALEVDREVVARAPQRANHAEAAGRPPGRRRRSSDR